VQSVHKNGPLDFIDSDISQDSTLRSYHLAGRSATKIPSNETKLRLLTRLSGPPTSQNIIIDDLFFFFWIVRLLALRPLLAYCASGG
jgi:hypothetical protein